MVLTAPTHRFVVMLERAWMCSGCGYVMDAVSPLGSEPVEPDEDDISLCLNCGAVYTRHADRWMPATPAEHAEFPPDVKREIAEFQITRSRVVRENLADRGGRT
jgi:ribosomal protein S27AE